ncbi:hypothetical protein HPP92_019592 [Vanilla planifolia]|uniref:Uncharacterized protein n=1 Tax=Vanilla planifolia TaxID=51239 RepID=A0A835UJB3_VANPL|nr:hypothetical protein HPP92_019592 [Vanilla planifolia]
MDRASERERNSRKTTERRDGRGGDPGDAGRGKDRKKHRHYEGSKELRHDRHHENDRYRPSEDDSLSDSDHRRHEQSSDRHRDSVEGWHRSRGDYYSDLQTRTRGSVERDRDGDRRHRRSSRDELENDREQKRQRSLDRGQKHERSSDREKKSERSLDREQKKERSSDSEQKRESSVDRFASKSLERDGFSRDDSVERHVSSSSRKRKDYKFGDDEQLEKNYGKRTRISDDVMEESRARRQIEDKCVKEESTFSKDDNESRRGRISKDRGKDELNDVIEDRKPKQKKEEGINDNGNKEARRSEKRSRDDAEALDKLIAKEGKENVRKEQRFKDEAKDEKCGRSQVDEPPVSSDHFGAETLMEVLENGDHHKVISSRSSSNLDGFGEPLDAASNAYKASSDSHSIHIKVPSINATNENEGVSITRSDEVTGKLSTDGKTSSVSGKSGGLSRDALAKAKKALQMQKELSEKLKRIPVLKKQPIAFSNDILHRENGVPLGGDSKSGTVVSFPSVSTPIQTMPSTPNVAVVGQGVLPGLGTSASFEAVKRAQELAAKMGFRQDPDFVPLINMFPGPSSATDAGPAPKSTKVPVLRLDAHGREIDEHGNVIDRPKVTNLSTLKVNINKQKKEAFQILRPELDADADLNPHFDPRMGINKTKLIRGQKGNNSNQFGEAQAKELKAKQSQLAKAKAESEDNPNLIVVGERVFKEKRKDEIPKIEWWDKSFLPSGSYDDVAEENLKLEKITIYVEHPRPIEPPAEPAPPPPQPLKLTRKEQKKLRTQRRLAKERDRQEMIRQGLIEPPKPKIKMSNLMKVLSSEATQDPTKLEKEVRAAALEREQAHIDRNIARKLTPQERREKKERKLFDDCAVPETLVSVYRINDLSHPQTRFKVDVNAQENRLSGCAVISDGITVVVVEGGQKSIRRYGKLLLKRINWAVAVAEDEDGEESPETRFNKCVLVWQGSVPKPSFNRFLVHQCRSEAAARKVFADAGVPHYWDLASNFSDELL